MKKVNWVWVIITVLVVVVLLYIFVWPLVVKKFCYDQTFSGSVHSWCLPSIKSCLSKWKVINIYGWDNWGCY